MAESIHAIWLMEEKVKIFRKLVWFIPIKPLTIIDEIITIEIKIILGVSYIKITIGAIFCHVNIIKQLNHCNPSIISGNQKWNGAAPIFVNKAVSKIILAKFLIKIISFIINIIVIIANKKIVEARAWVTKYFIADSFDITFFFEAISGIIDRRLISRPIHIPSHEVDEMAIIVPIIMALKNIIL